MIYRLQDSVAGLKQPTGTTMNKTFEQGREEIIRLCAGFDPKVYHAPEVKEADVRQSLIDPFFEALGWDVHNREQAALRLREVIPEESLEVEGQQKTPDYTFRMGQSVDFFVEAKKCAVDISADAASAYQVRRYGWSGRLAVSILTNFEQFAEYDCTQRPRPSDKVEPCPHSFLGIHGVPRPLARTVGRVFARGGPIRGL